MTALLPPIPFFSEKPKISARRRGDDGRDNPDRNTNSVGTDIFDTYAFVRLTGLARDDYIDRRQVQDAMRKLEEARSLIDKVDAGRPGQHAQT